MFGVRRSLGWAVTPVLWGAVAVTAYQLVCPFVGGAVVCAVALHLRRELRQARYVAGVAQSVLLRPLPARVEGLGVAAVQVSAERGAAVGGDLYDVVGTEFGVRVVMGDVRGHGLAALGTFAALLGGFREAVHDEPELGGVLRRLDRTRTPSSVTGAGCTFEPVGRIAPGTVTVVRRSPSSPWSWCCCCCCSLACCR